MGDAHGVIDAFGVFLTRHYANYYNRISFEFLHRLSREYGEEGLLAASETLIEAGRVCAFNTFGGIMQSTEWNALIRPSLASREDWVHGMVAVVNAFGWGRWQVVSVSETDAEFVLHDDYESVGYRAMYVLDDLVNGKEEKIDVSKVDVSMNGIELQDREFFAAIKEGREPNSSVAQVLPCYQVLHDLEQQLNAG